MIDTLKLRAIVNSSQEDLKSLAAAAGGDPATFYCGANFNGADLRGEDLRGFNLKAATFKRVRVDRKTLVDKEFSTVVGTERTLIVHMPLGGLLQGLLSSADIKVGRPAHNQYGDLIEDAIFGDVAKSYFGKNNTFSMPVDRDAFLFLAKSDLVDRGKHEFPRFMNSIEAVRHTFIVSSDDVVSKHFLKYLSIDMNVESGRRSMRQAALARRTAEAVRSMSVKVKMRPPELCCALLIAYASALRHRR